MQHQLRVATTFPKWMNRELDLVTYDSQKALNDKLRLALALSKWLECSDLRSVRILERAEAAYTI